MARIWPFGLNPSRVIEVPKVITIETCYLQVLWSSELMLRRAGPSQRNAAQAFELWPSAVGDCASGSRFLPGFPPRFWRHEPTPGLGVRTVWTWLVCLTNCSDACLADACLAACFDCRVRKLRGGGGIRTIKEGKRGSVGSLGKR